MLRARDLCGGRLVTGVPTAKDKLIELRFRELHRNGRGCGLLNWRGHDWVALFEDVYMGLQETLSSNFTIY